MKLNCKQLFTIAISMALVFTAACGNAGQQADGETKPIRIGLLASKTGALEAYGKQSIQGFELGIEYATDGAKAIDGRPIEVIIEDTETKPDVAVTKATKLLEEDKVDFLVGS